MWSTEKTPCGQTVYVTEVSTWAGNSYLDPITNTPLSPDVLRTFEPRRNVKTGEIDFFYGITPSGAFVKAFND